MPTDIYQYILQEETTFETSEIKVGDNWSWNFRNHVQMLFHLKNGVFFTGANDYLRAFKNIMEAMLNLSYWMEDIELKDVVFYIEEKNGRVLSLLVKKYHDEVYVKENDLDTFFDEITESDVDYGGALIQKTNTARPELLHFNSIAFCDQTDIEGGPLGFKFSFSPSKLRTMSKVGWGSEANGATTSIENLIRLADEKKDAPAKRGNNQSTGKNIDVYIVRGDLPDAYLKDNDNMDYFCYQLQIVAFYVDKDSKKQGVTLYRKQADPTDLKFHTSKKVYGRALGRGIGESMVHPQIWTNFLEIHKMGMLEAGSKVPLYTDDPDFVNKNRIQDMENLEITTIADNKRIYQVPTVAPANIQLFEKEINDWYQHAQLLGAAFDPLLGKEANSGTTFRGQNQVVQQGRGFHDRRRGQRAKFIELIYRDIILPDIAKEITGGKKFLSTLTAEEMAWVSEQLANNAWNQYVDEQVLDGKNIPLPGEKEKFIAQYQQDFSKKGNKHILEILKDNFKDVGIRMGINIAGKQKNLAGMSDKLMSIFQAVFANPQGFLATMQIPGMAQSFNDILEFSGISQVDFMSTMQSLAKTQPVPPQNTAQPSPEILPANQVA